jgi:hypothetical protein
MTHISLSSHCELHEHPCSKNHTLLKGKPASKDREGLFSIELMHLLRQIPQNHVLERRFCMPTRADLLREHANRKTLDTLLRTLHVTDKNTHRDASRTDCSFMSEPFTFTLSSHERRKTAADTKNHTYFWSGWQPPKYKHKFYVVLYQNTVQLLCYTRTTPANVLPTMDQ